MGGGSGTPSVATFLVVGGIRVVSERGRLEIGTLSLTCSNVDDTGL